MLLGYVGVAQSENLQIEWAFFSLFAGFGGAAFTHYLVAKVLGPLLFQCFPSRLPGGWERVRSLHFLASLGLVLLLWEGERKMVTSTQELASTAHGALPEESSVARVLLWSLVAVHLGLLLWTVNDHFVSIDSGYHVSLGRYYAEHLTAFWDHINFGPYGRPNLQGPLLHVGIGALGWLFGGSGDDYVLANSLLAIAQWIAAVFTVAFFSRRLGGDWAALFAVALFTGDFLASVFFSLGIPSGWIFVLTPWAVHAFLEERWLASALLVSAVIYVHLGGYATAPLGVFLAAVLTRRWRGLLWVGGLTTLFTAPYTIHLLTFRSWYIGETGHVATFASPLILALGLAGFLKVIRRPGSNLFLLVWVLAPIAWLFQDYTRFLGQSTLVAVALGGIVLANVRRGWVGVRWRPGFAAVAVLLATVAPMSLPAVALRPAWAIGLRYPRMMEWDEARSLAGVIREEGLEDRLTYVYNHSFGPALAVFTPLTLEKGHWVEVQPRPDPVDWVSAREKTYVMPVPPEDRFVRALEDAGLLEIHGGTGRSSVLTLARAADPEAPGVPLSWTVAEEARWLAEHAENNVLDPVREVLSRDGLTRRRARLKEQRIHAGRVAVATLVLAYALEADHPETAETVRGSVRGFSSIAAFLSDEWSIDFIDPQRHQILKENFGKLAEAVDGLGPSLVPSPALMDALEALFDAYFWAA
jgi:hypothetical protein